MSKPLAEEQLSTEWVFRGKLLHVRRDVVRLPDGATTSREYIEHPGAVVIIGLLDSGEVLFERQFRYALRREMIELPAGKIDPGEPPLETGKRELREETGYTAATWKHLGTLHLAIGYSDERIEIYLAQGLKYEGTRLDHDEFLDVFPLSPAAALDWVREGRITDAKTVAGLLWVDKVLGGAWNVDGKPGQDAPVPSV